ncbi:putative membrane protein [Babesia divergens]|uniref:Membrane protein n=1 Tax=Babesia divergens TaxID=32595 RepID=A0AAD9GDJ7_BABDI|nr:putative membrane protein [Babesia divergens]
MPMLSHMKEEIAVEEHSYLQSLTPDNVGHSGMNFMVDTIASLSKACAVTSMKSIEQTVGLEGFSRWYENVPEDAPAVYKAIDAIAKEPGLRLEVGYNDFRYVFDSGLGITGSSLLLRMKCARCASRGASLVVATVDTGSKREFVVDERGNVMRSFDSGNNRTKCSSSISGASIALTALREMSRYDNQAQDVLLLVTDRNLPYAAGTRQFLDDYFGRPDFKWRSGWLHQAACLDLGYGRCGSYEMNYEGLDGVVPNLDVFASFLHEADLQEVAIVLPGLWERVGRMSTNSFPHLQHVPMLSRNIAAFSITCARKAEKTDPNQADKLMRALLVTLRMHNNLETVLERNANSYQVVDGKHYLSQCIYLLLVPALLLGPTTEILYSGYTWDFHVLMASLCVFLINAFMGPWLSYRYLVRAVASDFDGTSTTNLSQVRIAILLLFFSSAALLAVNLLLFRVIPGRVFSSFDIERKVLERQALLLRLGYSVDSQNLISKVCLNLNVLMERLRRKTENVLGSIVRHLDAAPADSKRRRLSVKITALMQRVRSRQADAASKPAVTVRSTERFDAAVGEPADASQQNDEQALEELGGTRVAYPTNTGLPAPHVIASVGTLFFAVVFLYAMMVFNWPLSIVLTLILVPSLRRIRVCNHTRSKCWVDIVVCATYLLFIAALATRRNLVRGLRCEFLHRVYAEGRFNVLMFFVSPFHNIYVFVKNFPADEILAALRGPFVTKKLFTLAQQHVLFGSGTFPLIWFCAVPLVFHTVLIYALARFHGSPQKSD